jgi:hypothetical protein
LCQSRAIDLLRKKQASAVEWLENQPVASLTHDAFNDIEADECAVSKRSK